MSEQNKFDMELELRNKIADLEIRNLQLVEQIKAIKEEETKRFSDEQIKRIFDLVEHVGKKWNDYY